MIDMVATQLLKKPVERKEKQFKLNLRLSNEDERKYSRIQESGTQMAAQERQENLIFHPACKLKHPNQLR